MKRRDLLRSTTALAAASAFGLAGCSGSDGDGGGGGGGGDGNSCGTPSGSLADAAPSGSGYEQLGQPTTQSGDTLTPEGIVKTYSATYTASDSQSEFYSISITEFSSTSAAESREGKIAAEIRGEDGSDGSGGGMGTMTGAVGYVRTGKYMFVGFGSDEASLTDFMSTAPPLSGCASSAVTFVDMGMMTPESG